MREQARRTAQRLSALLLVLLFVFSTAACKGTGGGASAGPKKTITDCVGRTVEVPEDPQRIICMYASTAHMLAMLDKGDRIVGAADGVTRDQLMLTKYPAIEDVPTPYHSGSVNVEEVLSLDADLLFIREDLYGSEGEREKLDKTGIPYVVVDYYTLEELKKAIRVTGAAVGTEEKAEGYIAYMEQTIADVQAKLQGLTDGEKVQVYHSLNQATRTDIRDGLCASIFEAAGLIDVSAAAGMTDLGKNVTVTLEQIYTWDPAAIVCNEFAVADYIKAEDKWQGLDAVKNGRVYTLPIGATRWGHHGSMEPQMAVLFLAQLFYPDRFPDLDLRETVRQYYSDQFGMQLDDDTITKILSGRGMRESSPNLEME